MSIAAASCCFFVALRARRGHRVPAPARWISVVLGGIASLASLILLVASALHADRRIPPFMPTCGRVLSFGTLSLGADRLSALFLFVSGLVFLPVSIFSGSYLAKYLRHDEPALFQSAVLRALRLDRAGADRRTT